jgi:hypothetical protein
VIPRYLIDGLCEAAGVNVNHCTAIDIKPDAVTFHVHSEHEGKPYLTANREDVRSNWVRVPIEWSKK